MSAARRDPQPFFRGAELPRLLLLAALTVVGWAAFLLAPAGRRPAGDDRPAAPPPPLPPPDTSPEFQGIEDRTRMTARDNAAYAKLLERVRSTPWDELAPAARRDVRFQQLFEDPDRYRGLPIYLEGTVLRVIRQDVKDSKIYPDGVYYEAYAITPDSRVNPWVLAFETLPAGLPVGDMIDRPITFVGYFLKFWAYQGGVPFDKLGRPRPDQQYRSAPILVGRFPPARAGAAAPRKVGGQPAWLLFLPVALTLYFALRLILQLRRGPLARRPIAIPTASATDEIEPDRLAAWIEETGGGTPIHPATANGEPAADNGRDGRTAAPE